MTRNGNSKKSKSGKSTQVSAVNPPRDSQTSKGRTRPSKRGMRFGKIGKDLGSLFGPAGSLIGGAAGSIADQIFGMGDYTLRRNSLMKTRDQGPPTFDRLGNGDVVIRHREYIADVQGSTAFSLTNYPINPGLPQSFPWLSSIASAWEEYDFRGLVYQFKSTSAVAVNSTNTALGVVIMATDYDSVDANFNNKAQMESQQGVSSGSPSVSFLSGVECEPRQNVLSNLYIRSGSVPSNTDQRLYDLGNFQIATSGMQASSTIGELWVSYEVVLRKPVLFQYGEGSQHSQAVAGSATATNILGTGTNPTSGSSSLFSVPSTTTILVPQDGRYQLTIVWAGATGIAAAPTITKGSNISNLNLITGGNNGQFIYNSASGTGATATFLFTVNATGSTSANLLTVGGLTSMSGGNCDIFVTDLNYDML